MRSGVRHTASGGGFDSDVIGFVGFVSGQGNWEVPPPAPQGCGYYIFTYVNTVPGATPSWTTATAAPGATTPWETLTVAKGTAPGLYNQNVIASCAGINYQTNHPYVIGIVKADIVDLNPYPTAAPSATPLVLTNTLVPKAIGQHVALGILLTPTNAPTPTVTWAPLPQGTSVSASSPQIIASPYAVGTTPATLAPTAFSSPRIDFYWIVPITYTSPEPTPTLAAVVWDYGDWGPAFNNPATLSFNIKVERPTKITLKAVTTGPQVGQYGEYYLPALSLGQASAPAGITFTFAATGDSTYSGVLTGTQVINSSLLLGTTAQYYSNSLDNCPVYPGAAIPMPTIAPGQTIIYSAIDAPAQGLPNYWYYESLVQSYTMFFMYRPTTDVNDSIFVALGDVPWNWAGGAQNLVPPPPPNSPYPTAIWTLAPTPAPLVVPHPSSSAIANPMLPTWGSIHSNTPPISCP
jgi:hypothetical protein